MSLVELLNRTSEKNFAGEPQRIAIRLQPGLTPQEIKEFETAFPGQLPSGVQQLLAFASGFEVEPIGLVDFLGRHPFEFKDAFPYGVPLAGDGEGNFWVQDIQTRFWRVGQSVLCLARSSGDRCASPFT